MNLKYLLSLLFIDITGKKETVCGRDRNQEKRRRRRGKKGKEEAMLTGVREKFMIGLTVWD